MDTVSLYTVTLLLSARSMLTQIFFSGFCRGQESGSAWCSSLWSSCNHSSYVLRSTQGESTRTSVFVPSFITYRLRGLHWFLPQVPWSIIYCLFQFPVLCSEFFKLTTCLCEMYPAKMSLLPEELFKNLMASLEVGLSKYPFQRRNSVSTRIIFDGQNPHLWLGKLPSIFLFNTLKNGKKYWARFISQSPDMWDHFVSSFGPTSSLIRRFFFILKSSRTTRSSFWKDCVTSPKKLCGGEYPASDGGIILATDFSFFLK